MSRIIEQGVVIDSRRGAASAWAFLSYHAVPPATIVRVLSGPHTRRCSDTEICVEIEQACREIQHDFFTAGLAQPVR